MIKHWTREEELKLIELKSRGIKLTDIAVELGRTLEAVRTRSKRLSVQSGNSSKQGNFSWREDEVALLRQEFSYDELEKLLPHKTRRAIMSKCEKLGISKRFPGWQKSSGTMSPEKPTTLYLVSFEKFKKVGITQSSLKDRFCQDGAFEILDTVTTDLDSAKFFEAAILEKIRPYRIQGSLHRGGGECFVYDCALLEELL